MFEWLKGLFNRSSEVLPYDAEGVLALEGDVRSLKLELEEQEQLIATLKRQVEQERSEAKARIEESVESQIEELLVDVAAPVTQLITQAHLVSEGKALQVRDVLAVTRRLIHTLEDHGLTTEGDVGQTVPFDPNHHQLLRHDREVKPQEPVIVQFVGVAYRGKLLRRVSVKGVKES
jgi:molecular chaperone GrpE (heat shock protein)